MSTGATGFLQRYQSLIGNLPGDSALRAAAAAAFKTSGLPGGTQQRRIEAWKYTSLRPVAEADFQLDATPRHETETILASLLLLDAPRIVFSDGTLRSDLSVMPPAGFARFADQPDFGTLSWPDREPMVALNTMLARDGAALHVPAGFDGGLVQLVSIAVGDGDIHPRHSIRLAKGATLTVLEISAGQGRYLLNTVTEIHVAEGAHLTHIRLQDEALAAFHVSTTYADVAAGGTYDSFTLNLGARLSRTEIRTQLSGAGATVHLNAAQILTGLQHADFTTVVAHDAPGCASRQTVKNVLSGRSRGVFQGKIEVARIAQKTDGYQMNQALLLSPDAEIDCKPELEIFADDVKCSHGATVGELDAEQMFYLRSRGIPDAEARSILVRAFLAEALDPIADERIRGRLEAAVEQWWEKADSMNVMTKPAAFDVARIREDFPILKETIRGKPLVFLDSAASAQKPRVVIDAMVHAMEHQYANVHRGLHWMSERTTEAYEATRDAAAALMNANDRSEIVFTGNSTGAINLLAHSYGRGVLKPGQAVLISGMEHHSNIVPWQLLRDAHGIELRVAPVTDSGELDMAAFEALLEDGKVGLVAITHMSNVLGSITPAERIVKIAHAHGAKVMFDGSQAIVHRKIDVQALDCDFYVWTGHKLYGPTGIGVLWGRRELLERMPPFMGGGDMISSVTYEKSTWAEVPHKFEAGTPAILEGIGLNAAINYVQAIGYDAMAAHEASLTEHALARLASVEGVRILGQAQERGGVISFTLDKAHAHDVATLLDRQGIAVRAGNHCAEPLMRRFDVDSTARASFGVYTTHGEVDALVDGLIRVRDFFQ